MAGWGRKKRGSLLLGGGGEREGMEGREKRVNGKERTGMEGRKRLYPTPSS